MKREFTLTLDGTEYRVVADGDTVAVEGRPYTVEITDSGTVLVDGIAYDVKVEGSTASVGSDSHTVQVSGLTLVPTTRPVPRSSLTAVPTTGAEGSAVRAIMPGKMVRVLVAPGQSVSAGEPVCVLEAMKMENELRAQGDCIVKVVHVEPGDDVAKDQVLVEFE